MGAPGLKLNGENVEDSLAIGDGRKWGELIRESRERLTKFAMAGKLYALVDPFFENFAFEPNRKLEIRDTDPQFFEIIAWDRVTYEPPKLVQVPLEGLSILLDGLSTERWGVFVVSRFSLGELADHLQRFVIAKGPDQNPYFLRFHDASVLGVLLETWNADAKAKFFGPIDMFGLPDLEDMSIRLIESPVGSRSRKPVRPEACLLDLGNRQLEQCGQAIERDLIKVIYWHLRNYHAKVVQHVDRSLLQDRIAVSIARGRGYGFQTISDLAGFAALMFELAPNFDEHPAFQKILSDKQVLPELKLRRLSQTISEKDWREAMSRYDRSFWRALHLVKKP
ncbi:MAG: DUF4123 domain-containing protein [Bdellovibrionales bacterium]|nr:DUF4123 domain-containing protein [Bdellovibrionales bacterium]